MLTLNFYVHSYIQYCTLRKLCSMCQKRFAQTHIKNKHILVITFLKNVKQTITSLM